MADTYQKRVIYEAVTDLGSHPSAEHVYEHVAKQHPTISKATVFRNLNQMAGLGKLTNIGKIDGVARYDHNCHPHYHFECVACKQIYDVEGHINDIQRQVEWPEGFNMQEHVVSFRGLCKKCGSA